MLGGLVAAYVVARELPFLSTSGPFVFRDAGIVLIAGALICARGRARRPLRARRPDQARRPGARRRVPHRLRHPVRLLPGPRRHPVLPGVLPGRPADRARGGRDRERRELRRRARRARRRGRRHRRARVLPLLLPARHPQRGLARDHRRPAQRLAGRGVRGLPAAQLPPGPAVHGRQRVDADRPGALGQRAHAHRPVPARTSARAPRAPGPACCPPCCRCCCRCRS